MNTIQKQIAAAFSNGNFEFTFPYLADNVQWTVMGADAFSLCGKQAVIERCTQIASYFQSITTDFKTLNVIAENNRVAVQGTAEFHQDGSVIFIHACDVYEFDGDTLQTITSYCIRDKNS